MTRTPAGPTNRSDGLGMVEERPVDADVAALPDGGRLPQEPWQKGYVDGLRRLRAQGCRPVLSDNDHGNVAQVRTTCAAHGRCAQVFQRTVLSRALFGCIAEFAEYLSRRMRTARRPSCRAT